jgi:hypothetical protein
MNTKIKFIRFVFALMLVLSALGVSVSAVQADKPFMTKTPYSGDSDIPDLCSFSVHLDYVGTQTEIDYFDQNGTLIRMYLHFAQQDTFTANEKTLVGLPYKANAEIRFDSSGNWTQALARGVIEKVPLPDGSLFLSAGRVDFINGFALFPDKGKSGNVAGFCAALAP